MKPSIDDIALFIQVVKHGNLAGAARQLSLPAATVTRRLQKLEHATGAKLLHRSARQCVLTQDGEVYYQTYAGLVGQFESAWQLLSEESQQLSGKLKVLAPVNISHSILRPMWVSFTRQYPDIELELLLSNHPMDIIETQADLAVRIGKQNDSSLYQRRLGQIDTLLVATPGYIERFGMPQHPGELVEHDLIGLTMRPKWLLHNESTGQTFTVYPRCRAQINDPVLVKHFVCDSQGIALAPWLEVKAELEAGHLVRVLPQWGGEVRELLMLWPGGKLMTKRLKCLSEHIYQYVQQHL
ncbi:LysR family transcriptional regulator [Alteromonas gilva]|uniref:LysR family transcriptional regulator n=1 Tax=Alteromonas gilva TaxID=2987522 RepID=A0ABT5L1E4_9ALTE|nr:LysR family transcriptional regulator [Alteromonas gilva]MDC8830291.1 LysR family transcriptional regulator [Alteromonas gilva]